MYIRKQIGNKKQFNENSPIFSNMPSNNFSLKKRIKFMPTRVCQYCKADLSHYSIRRNTGHFTINTITLGVNLNKFKSIKSC